MNKDIADFFLLFVGQLLGNCLYEGPEMNCQHFVQKSGGYLMQLDLLIMVHRYVLLSCTVVPAFILGCHVKIFMFYNLKDCWGQF